MLLWRCVLGSRDRMSHAPHLGQVLSPTAATPREIMFWYTLGRAGIFFFRSQKKRHWKARSPDLPCSPGWNQSPTYFPLPVSLSSYPFAKSDWEKGRRKACIRLAWAHIGTNSPGEAIFPFKTIPRFVLNLILILETIFLLAVSLLFALDNTNSVSS